MKTVPVETLREAIDRWLADNELGGITWYSPDQWEARGEVVGDCAILHASIDGSTLGWILNNMWEPFYSDFVDLLKCHGYWHELGFSWSMHLYGEHQLLPF